MVNEEASLNNQWPFNRERCLYFENGNIIPVFYSHDTVVPDRPQGHVFYEIEEGEKLLGGSIVIPFGEIEKHLQRG